MKVVIVGSGYTGVWAYRALTRWLGKKVDITLVTKTTSHSFHGFIGEVLAGNLAHHLTSSPLEECFPKAKKVLGEAVSIDPDAHTLDVKTATNTVTIPYDHILIATGSEEHTVKIPGLTEVGWRLRTQGVPHQIIEKLTAVTAEVPAGTYTADNTVVIIGAGFTGTESAAALKRRFGSKLKVVLVTTTDNVIQEWTHIKPLQKNLARNLTSAGVELVRNARVTRVDAEQVYLDNGATIPAHTIIASMGMRPVHIAGLEQYIHAGTSLLDVDRNLYVGQQIWAAGDVAAVKNKRGDLVTKDALWAIYAGTRAGRNIALAARGKKPKPFAFPGLGSVATFAPGQSVGRLMGIPMNGYHLYALRQALFMWFVPSRKNAVRIMKSYWQNRKAGRAHLNTSNAA